LILADNSGIPLSLWSKAAVVGTAGFAYKLDEVDSLGVVYKTHYIPTTLQEVFFYFVEVNTQRHFPFFGRGREIIYPYVLHCIYTVNIYT